MIKILIAEDEEPIANLIRVNLKKAGYHCQCAYDGEEGQEGSIEVEEIRIGE